MNFGFSEQQQQVQNLARQILSDQVTADTLAPFDEYQSQAFDKSLWAQLATAGLLAVALKEQYGGMGFGFTELALFIEEIGRSIAPVPAVACLVSAALPVQHFGTDEQQKRLLTGVGSGECLLTAGLMESLNEDPSAPELTTAVASGDSFTVTGSKTCVPFATSADRILLSAKTDGGVVVLLVDPKARGVATTALRVSTYEPQFQLDLDEVVVTAEDVLAGPADGAAVMTWIAERTSAAICAHQTGLSDRAMRMTSAYTSERKQFGVPVATFQAVAHRSANCFIDVTCLRLNTYQAVSRLDSGIDATTEVQIAKVWAGDVGHRLSYASQHMHGGMGIDRDYPLWRLCLWARHNELMLGSSAKQLALLGARIAQGQAYCH